MDSCMAQWNQGKTASISLEGDVIFDLTCRNNNGKLEDKHYYHVIVNCLLLLSPSLALAANVSVASTQMKRRVSAYTNSENLRRWLRFLTPHLQVEKSMYSIAGFARRDVIRQPIVDVNHCHRSSEYLPCSWFLRDLGMKTVVESKLRSLKLQESSILNVLFIRRSGSSRDIQNLQELENRLISSRFNYSLVVFYGNESIEDTFLYFSFANVVIGYHGAGLSNVVFCKPSTMIVELSIWAYGNNLCLNESFYPKYAIWRSNKDLINTASVDWYTIYVPFNRSGFKEEKLQTYVQHMVDPYDRDGDHFLKGCGVYLLSQDVKTIYDIVEEHFSAKTPSDNHARKVESAMMQVGSVKNVLIGAGPDATFGTNVGTCLTYHSIPINHYVFGNS